MDEQVTEILNTLNEGLQDLPEYASEGWDIMVTGTRMDAIIWAGLGLILLIIGIYLHTHLKAHREEIEANDPPDVGIRLLVANLLLICGSLFILPNIASIILPEYTLIRSILS